MPKINVSFKENVEELKLYNEAIKHCDKSAFVKELIKEYLEKKVK